MGQKLNIKWHTFMLHGVDLLRELMESKRYFDVTLVSDDYFHFKLCGKMKSSSEYFVSIY